MQNEWLQEYKLLLDRLRSESPHKNTTIPNAKLIALLESSPFIDMAKYPIIEDETYEVPEVLQEWKNRSFLNKIWQTTKNVTLFGLYVAAQFFLIPIYAMCAIIFGALSMVGGCFVLLVCAFIVDLILTYLGYGSILNEETRKNLINLLP